MKIVLHKIGIGVFRQDLNSDEKIQVWKKHINDVLKTLTITNEHNEDIDFSYKSPPQFQDMELVVTRDNPLINVVKQLRGEEITLEKRVGEDKIEEFTGINLGMQTFSNGNPLLLNNIVLMDTKTSKISWIPILHVSNIFISGKDSGKIKDFLSAANMMSDTATIDITPKFYSKGQQEKSKKLIAKYAREVPVWKVIYHLNVGEKGESQVLTYAIVENDSTEDWKNVDFTIVTGRPLSYKIDLYKLLTKKRADFPPEYLARAMKRGPEVEMMEEEEEEQYEMEPESISRDRPSHIEKEEYGVVQPHKSFNIKNFNLERGRSLKVHLDVIKVETHSVLLYDCDKNEHYPYNSYNVIPRTEGFITVGPMVVYDRGDYVGDTVIKHMLMGKNNYVNYALEKQIYIDKNIMTPNPQIVMITISGEILSIIYMYKKIVEFEIKRYKKDKENEIGEHFHLVYHMEYDYQKGLTPGVEFIKTEKGKPQSKVEPTKKQVEIDFQLVKEAKLHIIECFAKMKVYYLTSEKDMREVMNVPEIKKNKKVLIFIKKRRTEYRKLKQLERTYEIVRSSFGATDKVKIGQASENLKRYKIYMKSFDSADEVLFERKDDSRKLRVIPSEMSLIGSKVGGDRVGKILAIGVKPKISFVEETFPLGRLLIDYFSPEVKKYISESYDKSEKEIVGITRRVRFSTNLMENNIDLYNQVKYEFKMFESRHSLRYYRWKENWRHDYEWGELQYLYQRAKENDQLIGVLFFTAEQNYFKVPYIGRNLDDVELIGIPLNSDQMAELAWIIARHFERRDFRVLNDYINDVYEVTREDRQGFEYFRKFLVSTDKRMFGQLSKELYSNFEKTYTPPVRYGRWGRLWRRLGWRFRTGRIPTLYLYRRALNSEQLLIVLWQGAKLGYFWPLSEYEKRRRILVGEVDSGKVELIGRKFGVSDKIKLVAAFSNCIPIMLRKYIVEIYDMTSGDFKNFRMELIGTNRKKYDALKGYMVNFLNICTDIKDAKNLEQIYKEAIKREAMINVIFEGVILGYFGKMKLVGDVIGPKLQHFVVGKVDSEKVELIGKISKHNQTKLARIIWNGNYLSDRIKNMVRSVIKETTSFSEFKKVMIEKHNLNFMIFIEELDRFIKKFEEEYSGSDKNRIRRIYHRVINEQGGFDFLIYTSMRKGVIGSIIGELFGSKEKLEHFEPIGQKLGRPEMLNLAKALSRYLSRDVVITIYYANQKMTSFAGFINYIEKSQYFEELNDQLEVKEFRKFYMCPNKREMIILFERAKKYKQLYRVLWEGAGSGYFNINSVVGDGGLNLEKSPSFKEEIKKIEGFFKIEEDDILFLSRIFDSFLQPYIKGWIHEVVKNSKDYGNFIAEVNPTHKDYGMPKYLDETLINLGQQVQKKFRSEIVKKWDNMLVSKDHFRILYTMAGFGKFEQFLNDFKVWEKLSLGRFSK